MEEEATGCGGVGVPSDMLAVAATAVAAVSAPRGVGVASDVDMLLVSRGAAATLLVVSLLAACLRKG